MQQTYILTPWSSAGGTDTPAIPFPDPGTGYVSWALGYTFDYQRNLQTDSAAKSPKYTEFNYLMNVITTVMQNMQQFGSSEFITSANNNGTTFSYGQGAIMRWSSGGTAPFHTYISLINNNTNLPSAANSGWLQLDQELRAGALLSDTFYSSSATYTFSANANLAYAEIGAGGAGGGGCAAAATGQGSAGSGGGGGAVMRIVMAAPAGQSLATLIPAGFSVNIGAGGAGGSAGANNGTAGGNTTLTIGGNTYVAQGGSAGIGGTSVPGPSVGGGGEGGTANFYSLVTVNGVSIYIFESNSGGVGGLSHVMGPGNVSAGYGGANGLGRPGALTTPTGSGGTPASNFSGGGSGASQIAGGVALNGGNGQTGFFRFTQYSV